MDAVVLEKVRLNNFRSHERYSLDLNKKTTLILGENGWGKTSILEALYITLQGKSFRAVDREIMRRGAEFYRAEVSYRSGEKVVVVYGESNSSVGAKKTFLVQDKKYARLPKKFKYPVVLFLPEDLHLISSSPTSKREYFDRILAQLDEKYSSSLSRYNKALKQRNELLKQDYVTAEMLFSWDILMAKYGVEIQKRREELVAQINEKLTETYRGISENGDTVGIRYKSYTETVRESGYIKLLAMDFSRDTMTGHTNFGVHKDDYEFMFNDVGADGSASRGEVRSIILALKFIEAELLFETLGKKSVVMLDDVFSELDEKRQKSLVKNFKENQVILTSVKGV